MRLESGASLSVVNSGTWPPTRFSASVEVFGSTALTMMRVDAGRDQIVHQPLLDRGRGLLRILELQVVVRQLALRLLHAGLGQLPEVRRAVDDEGQRLLVLRRGAHADGQGESSGHANQINPLHQVPPFALRPVVPPRAARLICQINRTKPYASAGGGVNVRRAICEQVVPQCSKLAIVTAIAATAVRRYQSRSTASVRNCISGALARQASAQRARKRGLQTSASLKAVWEKWLLRLRSSMKGWAGS